MRCSSSSAAVPRRSTKASPQPAWEEANGRCAFDHFQDAQADTDGRSAFVFTRLRATVSFVEVTCALHTPLTEFAMAVYQLQPDRGESVGQPVSLCFHAEHDISAQSSGASITARARFGGEPLTDPAHILRNAVAIYSAGPTTVMNGSAADQQGG